MEPECLPCLQPLILAGSFLLCELRKKFANSKFSLQKRDRDDCSDTYDGMAFIETAFVTLELDRSEMIQAKDRKLGFS